MRSNFIIFLCILSTALFSQKIEIDSLEVLLKTDIKEDTSTVILLNKIADSLYYSELNKSFFYAKQANKLASKINYIKGKAESNRLIGGYHLETANFKKAFHYFNIQLELSEQINDSKGIANSNNNIGLVKKRIGDYIEAFEYFKKSSIACIEIGDSNGIIRAYINIGIVLDFLEDYKRSIEYYSKALELSTKAQNNETLGIINNNIGMAYGYLNKDSLSLKYFKQSLLQFKKSNHIIGIANGYYNIGDIYIKWGEFDIALDYFNKSIILSKEINSQYLIAWNYYGISEVYLNKKLVDKAQNQGIAAYELADKLKDNELLKLSSKILADIYASNNNYKKAYELHQIFKNVSDSLLNANKIREIARKDYELELEKKQHEKEVEQKQMQELHKAEISKQKLYKGFLISIAFFLSLVLLLVQRNYAIKKNDNKKLKEREIELRKLNKAISNKNVHLIKSEKNLKEANATKDKFFSIIAHDIKNPLNTLIGFSDLLELKNSKLDEERKNKYLLLINQTAKNLYSLLENLLQWSRSQTGKLAFSPTKLYLIDITRSISLLFAPSALKKNIIIHYNIEKSVIVFADFAMITTVMRNLISNAIKFTKPNGNIFIDSQTLPSEVKVIIRDDGLGISPEGLSKIFRIDSSYSTQGTTGERGTGIGLILCQEFIEKNGGKIYVESEIGKGAKFWFTLPKEKISS